MCYSRVKNHSQLALVSMKDTRFLSLSDSTSPSWDGSVTAAVLHGSDNINDSDGDNDNVEDNHIVNDYVDDDIIVGGNVNFITYDSLWILSEGAL